MGSVQHDPFADWRNFGWTLIGGLTTIASALANASDSNYIRCPASKSDCAVTFPVDITSVPEGAVITSVSVKLRAGTGTGSAPSGTPPSITLSVAALDDSARFTTRVIYPTSTITTFEVATYTRDALGLAWDIHRLNNIVCRLFSVVGVFDLIRCYRLWCDVNYRVRPVVTIQAPTGTVLTPSPVVRWTYTQADGDPIRSSEYRVFTEAQAAQVAFDPNTVEPVYKATVAGDLTQITLPTSLDANSYRMYVRSTSSYGAVSLWASRQFVVNGPSPAIPGVPDSTGTLPSGTAVLEVVPDSSQGSATLRLQDTSNLLSPNEADFEVSADGVNMMVVSNCSASRDSTVGFPGGSASMKMAVTAATGDMALFSSYVEVAPDQPMCARAQLRANSTGRPCRVKIQWLDSSFSQVGLSTGSDVTDATSTWTECVVNGTSPANAVYARAIASVDAAAVAEIHWVDHFGLMYGTDSPWSDGGHTSRNMLSSWYSSAEGTAGTDAWTAGTATTSTTASVTGTGADGGQMHKMTYVGLSPTIAWRGFGTAFNSTTAGQGFTLNKPAGLATGDLMLAYVTAATTSGGIVPPAGWDLVTTVEMEQGASTAGSMSMYVLKRTATGSEPASWTDGFVEVSVDRRSALVVAYSGAADASLQFIGQQSSSTGDDTPSFLTVPAISNSDPNAWRVSAFAVSDNTASGTLTANRQEPSVVPAITFVSAGTIWSETGSGSTFTLNKPPSIVANDTMVAYLSMIGNVTVTPPAGWTLTHSSTAVNGSAGESTLAVMHRVATGSEPASWTGSVSGTIRRTKVTRVTAYRNVDTSSPIIADNAASSVNQSTLYTPSVTNTTSGAWRLCGFAGLSSGSSGASNHFSASDENNSGVRANTWSWYNAGIFGGNGASSLLIIDSNGGVGAASYSKYATSNVSLYAGNAWMGFLRPLSAPPSGVADETARTVVQVGSSNPWITTRAFDSNGVVPATSQALTGVWDQSDRHSQLGWQGLIRPATPVTSGYAVATMATTIDVSKVSVEVDKTYVTASASFLGTTAGTPYLTVYFYRGNQLIASRIAEGTPFGTTVWQKSTAVFECPEGTTRMKLGVSVSDRAVSDEVYWDRASLAFGTDTTFRRGTSRTEHPVWTIPIIEYADDDGSGYGDWAELPGSKLNVPAFADLTELSTYTDHTVVPLTSRKYRVRSKTFGLNGDQFVSAWGPESSEFSFEAENWWLKDIENPESNIELKVKWAETSVTRKNTATVFQAVGEDLPVVLTEGYKGDTFGLDLIPVRREQFALLKRMLESGKTLFLQSDIDNAWWVRPSEDLQVTVLPTSARQSDPLRQIKVTFVEVEQPHQL
jgi:hypothetical protein